MAALFGCKAFCNSDRSGGPETFIRTAYYSSRSEKLGLKTDWVQV